MLLTVHVFEIEPFFFGQKALKKNGKETDYQNSPARFSKQGINEHLCQVWSLSSYSCIRSWDQFSRRNKKILLCSYFVGREPNWTWDGFEIGAPFIHFREKGWIHTYKKMEACQYRIACQREVQRIKDCQKEEEVVQRVSTLQSSLDIFFCHGCVQKSELFKKTKERFENNKKRVKIRINTSILEALRFFSFSYRITPQR